MPKHNVENSVMDSLIEQATEKYYSSDIQYEMDLDTYLEKYVSEKE